MIFALVTMIWDHKPTSHRVNPLKLGRRYCVYCRTILDRIALPKEEKGRWQTTVNWCPACGWWWLDKGIYLGKGQVLMQGTYSVLRDFDLTDLRLPLIEIRRYLISNYRARLSISWTLIEDVVAAVFRDFGYSVRVTARQGDGGIDAICDGPNGDQVGVQVKRYRDKIQAHQIRELVGALVIGHLTSGVFVTTSGFTRGARRAAQEAASVGMPVELIDATAFYDALRITTRSTQPSLEEWGALVEGAHAEFYDEIGFVGSPFSHNHYIKAFYREAGESAPNLRALERAATPTVVTGPRGYRLLYVFDEVLRLFVGITEGPSGPVALLQFEDEQDAEKVFSHWLNTGYTHLR